MAFFQRWNPLWQVRSEFVHPALEMIKPLASALGGHVVDASDLQDGDITLRWEGAVIGGYRPPGLNGALERLLLTVERELGHPINPLDRAGKQSAVRRLDELGAFTLRRAVEDIADRLEVSRFTVYNYLNASTRPPEEGIDR